MADVDFTMELEKQLVFLKNSCELYDRGVHEEAVRIATVIRVILHDTKSSTSLLNHLGAKQVQLASSLEVYDDNICLAYSGSLSHIHAEISNPEEGSPTITTISLPYGPDILARGCVLSAEQWWNQNIYLLIGKTSYSRKDIVLAAANKDGGAHVDKQLPPMYLYLAGGHASSEVVSTNEKKETVVSIQLALGGPTEGGTPVKNFQYADLRQMATELLHSPALLALAV